MSNVPFNQPMLAGNELAYVREALESAHRHGSGPFTRRCQEWLENWVGGKALLTQSGTAALEMAALLAGVGPGDEVIMPSYTFVSTANAFVLRGAVPVFVDVEPDTLNIDPAAVAAAVTTRTRAIVAVHYGGVGCDMAALAAVAERHRLLLIEDAAQAILAYRDGRPLGSFGTFAAFSFHDSKNISSGEGGALVINDPAHAERAEILWEKGTNRSQFLRNLADKYTWVDVGSSFLPSEVTAAFLLAQLEQAEALTEARLAAWRIYADEFAPLARRGLLGVGHIPAACRHNAHLFFLMLPPGKRAGFIAAMAERGITTPFHYVPLHSSPAGLRFGRTSGAMTNTERAGADLVRLPMHNRLTPAQAGEVVQAAAEVLQGL